MFRLRFAPRRPWRRLRHLRIHANHLPSCNCRCRHTMLSATCPPPRKTQQFQYGYYFKYIKDWRGFQSQKYICFVQNKQYRHPNKESALQVWLPTAFVVCESVLFVLLYKPTAFYIPLKLQILFLAIHILLAACYQIFSPPVYSISICA